jgi:hypothetical protein
MAIDNRLNGTKAYINKALVSSIGEMVSDLECSWHCDLSNITELG